jgi:hypothetical protein
MSKLSRVFATSRIVTLTVAASFSLAPVVVPAADRVIELGEASSTPPPAASSVSSPWPIQIVDYGRTFLIYQPQIDRWENNRLEGRSAVSVRNDASGRQNFGVVYFSARTELDSSSRTVTVRDAVIGKADFPAVTAGVDDYLMVLRPQLAAQSWRVAQERLLSDMEIDNLARQSVRQPLKNDPPRILFSERPAVLIPIDGDPLLRPVADSGLMRVANTRALIVLDKATSRYFLFVSDHWMEAPSLDGPWRVTTNPSAQLERAKQLAVQQDQVDLLDADAGDAAVMPANLVVFVSTTPTELLQTDGPAQYAPIERTQLLYVTNSPNKLFLDLRTQNYYALISGRWYRSTTLGQGPWSFVPATSLPGDFAMIPSEHPTESVRAAVAGTPQAREAAIANTVPQVATVTRSATHLDITYDGAPVFQPIEGTALQNAVNAPVPVIRVSDGSFYALDDGVWFVASSPFGPWAVTSYVPTEIYSIPRSSPLYYVTYVRVYDATPEVVYVGYTPGYVGSYMSSDNVVVYGTGWPYRPWIGSVWYGAPLTWGFGFSFVYSWWYPYPWYSWHRVAWAPPPPCFRPSWGPWHAPVRHGQPGLVAGGPHVVRSSGPERHNVGRIYDRWDRKSVAWNGPATIRNHPIVDRQRPGARSPSRPISPAVSRPTPGSGFVAGPDGHWRRIGDDGNRDQGGREAQRVPGNAANSPSAQTGHAAQMPPAVQTPWRRAPVANQDVRGRMQSAPQRIQPPSFGGNERRSRDDGELSPRERGRDQRPGNEAVPRARVGGRFNTDRSRADPHQDRQALALPSVQSPHHIPPVAGAPVERRPLQYQRGVAPSRSFSIPPGSNDRQSTVNPGRGMERPNMNSGRMVERSADRPQVRGAEGHGNSNGGMGRGLRFGER